MDNKLFYIGWDKDGGLLGIFSDLEKLKEELWDGESYCAKPIRLNEVYHHPENNINYIKVGDTFYNDHTEIKEFRRAYYKEHPDIFSELTEQELEDYLNNKS